MRNSKGLRPKVASGTDLAESTPKALGRWFDSSPGCQNEKIHLRKQMDFFILGFAASARSTLRPFHARARQSRPFVLACFARNRDLRNAQNAV